MFPGLSVRVVGDEGVTAMQIITEVAQDVRNGRSETRHVDSHGPGLADRTTAGVKQHATGVLRLADDSRVASPGDRPLHLEDDAGEARKNHLGNHWIHRVSFRTRAEDFMVNAAWQLVTLFGAVLDLCRLRADETVAVLTGNGENSAFAEAFLAAVEERGAQSFQVNVAGRVPLPHEGRRRTPLSGKTSAVRVLGNADLVIDLIGLVWSPEQQQIQSTGARVLTVRESVETIVRMFPTPDLRRRVEAAARMLGAAREMRITSPAGTDITYRLGQYPTGTQYGYTDEPGRWDNLPGGLVYTGGNDTEIEGTVVVDTGDILLPFKRYASAPIRVHIARGQVAGIEGGLDAEIVRRYLARWDDPRAYAVSHIGWGMDEKASWDFLATSPQATESGGRDGRAYAGNVLFSTGPNTEIGGTNDTPCHLDIPLRGCDLFLDGRTIIERGAIVAEQLAALSTVRA